MLINRKSPFSGKVHVLEIDVTREQIANWRAGKPIQDAMPNLTAAEREFIKTGITAAEWKEAFGEDDDNE